MAFHDMAGAACRALTARKDGPSLYDVCDPLLLKGAGGDRHLAQFYRTALANPALRPLLRRTGLVELNDASRLGALREALARARDDETPDWAAIGQPVAGLLETVKLQHPRPKPSVQPETVAPKPSDIERVIRACGAHLLRSYRNNGFIPAYAAFNLIGDPDMRGREFLMALTGLEARGYKNSTLLFTLARIFIARSPARELINPPWKGIAEPMWQPMQIRHRSAYYDAFYIESLLGFIESGLASTEETNAAKRAIAAMADFCLGASRERVAGRDGTAFDVVTAIAPAPHPRFSRFFAEIKEKLGFGLYVPDCHTAPWAFPAATQAGLHDPMLDQPLPDFYRGYQVKAGANAPKVTVPINDHIDYAGGIVTWIDNINADRPYGNDLDPTLNLDVLEVSFRHLARWKSLETPQRLELLRGIVKFQRNLAASGAFADPRSHIYYLPELYCAYFGRCYAAFMALPPEARRAIDPDGAFEFIRERVLAYVRDVLIANEMNVFDAALALIAMGHLGAEVSNLT